MTVSAWQIYLVTRLDSINGVLAVLFPLTLIVVFIGTMFLINDDALEEKAVPTIRKAVVILSVLAPLLGLALMLVPSSKEAAAMMVVPKVVNSKLVQQDIPEAVRELCRQVLDKEKK